MKHFFQNTLLFLLLFFLVDKLFYWKIEALPEQELDKRLEWILEGKMNKDILIFGSSRAQHGLYSDAIQDSLKRTTFNLGYRGCNIDFQLFLLKKVLKHNKKPKVIFLTIDEDREFLPEKTLQFRYDKLYSLVKYQEITHELVDRKDISPFAVVLYSARLGWEKFLKPKPISKYENWTPGGTVLLDDTESDFDKIRKRNKNYNIDFELPERLAVFKEFQLICQKEKIQLFVLIPPTFAEQNIEFVKRINSLLINQNDKVWNEHNEAFKKADYFSDEAHLNKKGAVLYTNEIIKRLKTEL